MEGVRKKIKQKEKSGATDRWGAFTEKKRKNC